MNCPLVSVVMPSYNCAKFVTDAITSVLWQTYSNIQIVIVDDCSSDGTGDLIRYKFNSDIEKGKIKYILNNCNMERSTSRNIGVQCSDGEYVAFIDADDLWLPNHLEIAIARLIDRDYDVYYSYPAFIDSSGMCVKPTAYYPQYTLEEMICRAMLPFPTGLIMSRSNYLLSEGFSPAFNQREDWEFIARLYFQCGNKMFVSFSPTTCFIRIHSSNTSASYSFYEFTVRASELIVGYINKSTRATNVNKSLLISLVDRHTSLVAFSRHVMSDGWKFFFKSISSSKLLLFDLTYLFAVFKRGFIFKPVRYILLILSKRHHN